METTHPKVFALKNAGLEDFLYADIGAERNGSPLTILSMIARLGRDPWAEAERWAALPRTGAIEGIAEDIAQMSLEPSGLVEPRVTAARVVQLLPATPRRSGQDPANETAATVMPAWMPTVLLYGAMAFGLAFSAFWLPKPALTAITPIEQPIAVPGSVSVPGNKATVAHDGQIPGAAAPRAGLQGK